MAILTFLVSRAAISFLLHRVRRWSEHDGALSQVLAKVLSGTSNFLLFLASLLVGLGMLDLPERWLTRVGSLWFVVAALQIGLWANRAIGLGLGHYFARHRAAGLNQGSALATLSAWGARVLLWSVVLLAMLSNLGVNITAFVASLGVGGIAVALAVQNILGDLFASLSIAVDKPFEVGDFIVIGPLAGTVEHVGLKTTRIRSLGGEQIVMANASMISSTIQNYKRLQERRIVFEFGLSYDTPTEAVKRQVLSKRPSRPRNRCVSTAPTCAVSARRRWNSNACTSSRTLDTTCTWTYSRPSTSGCSSASRKSAPSSQSRCARSRSPHCHTRPVCRARGATASVSGA